MGTQLQQWKAAVVATSPHAPIAVAGGWVLTRLFVYEAAILLPINSWASLIPIPSVSVFIIAIATVTINVLSASTDASRLFDWFENKDHESSFLLDLYSEPIEWRHRAATQLIVSFRCSVLIALPFAVFGCVINPASMTKTVLFDFPALILSLTALLLSPMPCGSSSPHWFVIATRLITAHLARPMMSDYVRLIDWHMVVKHPRWGNFARLVWIVGRVNAALVWQLPSLMLFHLIQGWIWPTRAGTLVGLSFMFIAGGLTAIVSAAASIRDWRCIASTLYQRDASIDCHGVMANVLGTFDKPAVAVSTPQANSLFIIQLIPITVGLVIGRATYSLPVAILFISFVAYSQFHAVAWSYAGLTIRLPYTPPVNETPVIRRPPDEIVGGAFWTSEADISAISERIKRRDEQGLEEDR